MNINKIKQEAEAGDECAQNRLGVMYAKGQGVPQDDTQALNWFRQAAEQGHAEAQYNLRSLNAYIYAAHAISSDASSDRRKVFRRYRLGWESYVGRGGMPQDDTQAAHWYRLAADQGHAEAQFNLGWMHDQGLGVTQDYTQAVEWYRKAAEQGHVEAQANLGARYSMGRMGLPQDDEQAAHWLRKAAEQGHAEAQYTLGRMYANGEGVPQDYAQAAHWFRKAADQGNTWAQEALIKIRAA